MSASHTREEGTQSSQEQTKLAPDGREHPHCPPPRTWAGLWLT